jgi:hypothetical protein
MARISVPLTAEEEATLVARAKARGVSVDVLVRNAILEVISGASEVPTQFPLRLSVEEVNATFDEAADMIPEGTPPLSDEAFSREGIYTREDEWNRGH